MPAWISKDPVRAWSLCPIWRESVSCTHYAIVWVEWGRCSTTCRNVCLASCTRCMWWMLLPSTTSSWRFQGHSWSPTCWSWWVWNNCVSTRKIIELILFIVLVERPQNKRGHGGVLPRLHSKVQCPSRLWRRLSFNRRAEWQLPEGAYRHAGIFRMGRRATVFG